MELVSKEGTIKVTSSNAQGLGTGSFYVKFIGSRGTINFFQNSKPVVVLRIRDLQDERTLDTDLGAFSFDCESAKDAQSWRDAFSDSVEFLNNKADLLLQNSLDKSVMAALLPEEEQEKLASSGKHSNNAIRIHCKTLLGKQKTFEDVSPTDTILEFKTRLSDEGTPERLNVIFAAKVLSDADTFESSKVPSDAVLFIVVKKNMTPQQQKSTEQQKNEPKKQNEPQQQQQQQGEDLLLQVKLYNLAKKMYQMADYSSGFRAAEKSFDVCANNDSSNAVNALLLMSLCLKKQAKYAEASEYLV